MQVRDSCQGEHSGHISNNDLHTSTGHEVTISFPLGVSSTQDGNPFITILESGHLAGLGLYLALGPLFLISVFFSFTWLSQGQTFLSHNSKV